MPNKPTKYGVVKHLIRKKVTLVRSVIPSQRNSFYRQVKSYISKEDYKLIFADIVYG